MKSKVVTTFRKYPILLAGYDIQRWEEVGGKEWYFSLLEKRLLFWKVCTEMGPTHLQYKSSWGFLITWPFCVHVWKQITPQIDNKPGTEKVFYFRIGFARWEAGRGVYIVPTLYLGLHWD